jgi:hypothetical protein
MSTLLNFEDFLNESTSMEAIEAPELQGKTTDIDGYNSQVSNMLATGEEAKVNNDPYYSDQAKAKAYVQDTKNIVAAYANKKFKAPSWGAIKLNIL